MKLQLMLAALAAVPACGRDQAPAAPAGGTVAPPTATSIAWDDPAKATQEIDWPMPGVAAEPAVDAASFGRGGGDGTMTVWRRLAPYSSTFLKAWRQALEAADPPPPGDVVDAFNELAFAVTGPSGFWRKTVAGRWLGCEANADSEPCKKVDALKSELEQWDAVQKQIETLPPERAAQFLARNETRIITYLDTYVPKEPSSEAMKTTAFYRKNLAQVLETWDATANQKDL